MLKVLIRTHAAVAAGTYTLKKTEFIQRGTWNQHYQQPVISWRTIRLAYHPYYQIGINYIPIDQTAKVSTFGKTIWIKTARMRLKNNVFKTCVVIFSSVLTELARVSLYSVWLFYTTPRFDLECAWIFRSELSYFIHYLKYANAIY